MKTVPSSGELDYRWAGVTAISGIVGIVSYAGTSAASHSTSIIIYPAGTN